MCKYCAHFVNPQDLEQHIKDRHFCDICQDFFRSGSKCVHLKEKFPSEHCQCEFCDRSFSSRGLKNHIKGVHKPKPEKENCFLCPTCGKSFYSELQLENHEKGTCMKKFECKDCSKFFTTHQILRKHLRVKHSPKKIRCQLCIKTFSHTYLLKEHMRNVHEKKILCHHCHLTFSRKSALDYHIKSVHEGTRNHKCNQCNGFFLHQSALIYLTLLARM